MARSIDTIDLTDAEVNTVPRVMNSNSNRNANEQLECAICLQTCMHPARLPCNHIFCFLCIKGVAYKSRRCALCRRDIPPEFLENPVLVNNDLNESSAQNDGYQWYYEGRHGWWQYDARTCKDIEDAFQKGEKFCTILVAGYLYIVNFETMEQLRQFDPTRRRLVKRDLATIEKKGIAGLRLPVPLPAGAGLSHNSSIDNDMIGSHRNRLRAAVESARHAFDLMNLRSFLNNRANASTSANDIANIASVTNAITNAHAYAAANAYANANLHDGFVDDEEDDEDEEDEEEEDEDEDDAEDDLYDLYDADEGLFNTSDISGDDIAAAADNVDENVNDENAVDDGNNYDNIDEYDIDDADYDDVYGYHNILVANETDIYDDNILDSSYDDI